VYVDEWGKECEIVNAKPMMEDKISQDFVIYFKCMCEILDRSRVSSFRLSLYRPSFRIRCMEQFLGGLSNVLDVPFKPQSNK
jgi:hypothetical protein